ncbi:peptidoglycan editing factor PgeF [Dysgonomonas sp. 216]|uniref:peptidoglycan editing factor PgeF n=1 Tax=Dysgonomonas sp. 216 TaxID=2302934 RepID=UPI0013CF8959|nr:peptidoglycan editing factor PgeF [Dysgonomonas sp. 216]NDW19275.1 peptidoglycan editing factor PgeF [Dysgonomonas sp. 216]
MIQSDFNKGIIHFENLQTYSSLIHLSTTIKGGVSSGNYSSFNLGEYSGDSLSNVVRNRKHLASMLNIEADNLILPYQTHEDTVLVIDDVFLQHRVEQQKHILHGVDALITNNKGVFIGVTTADCVPLIIYDPKQDVLGVAHAGWRGTVARIASKTVRVMIDRYSSNPSDLIVGIAPSISQEFFEVGEEVAIKFEESGFDMVEISRLNKATAKMHINLQQANASDLIRVGVLPDNIEISGLCTYSNPDMFFSARRQTIKSGRMVTGGLLKNE